MSWRIFNGHLNGLGRERQRLLGGRCREVARLYQMSLTRIETPCGLRKGKSFPPMKTDACSYASVQHAAVAQSVEQGTENPCVGGSIPPLSTIMGL